MVVGVVVRWKSTRLRVRAWDHMLAASSFCGQRHCASSHGLCKSRQGRERVILRIAKERFITIDAVLLRVE